MGHIRDRWTDAGPSGRRIRNDRWGRGRRWQARWTESTGRERYRASATKDEAEFVLARVTVGDIVPRAQRTLTFGVYAEQWRRERLHHRDSTAEAAEGMFRRMLLPQLGELPLPNVTRGDVQQAVVEWSEHYAPSTVRIAYGYVASVFKDAVLDQLAQRSPCVRINLPALPDKRVIPLSVDQVKEIAQRVPAWYRSMVIVGAATGLRGGELRGLTWDRVSDVALLVDRQLVRTRARVPVFGPPKSSAGFRTVAHGAVAASALEQHLKAYGEGPERLVWFGRGTGPVSRGDASDVWRAATTGMSLRPRSGWHELRHFHASALIGAGLSPRAVADRLGHADVAETLRNYAHLWPTDQERAVKAIDGMLTGIGDGR